MKLWITWLSGLLINAKNVIQEVRLAVRIQLNFCLRKRHRTENGAKILKSSKKFV
jgi:hypothetical protein